MSDTAAPPRARLIVAAALASALAVAVVVLGLVASPDGEDPGGSAEPPGPLPLVSIPAPEADTPQCDRLTAAAPDTLESKDEQLRRRTLAEPAPPATLAWGVDNPVVLRCGLDRPPELTRTSPLQVVNGVQWLPVSGQGSTTFYAVDREVHVALTVPEQAGTGPLQETSDTVRETLPEVPLQFG
ncbi:DUF3515 domain-containing protein [Saccharomonospora iraqiensis]|uniref:DUF3515 domain-containing protein n=1 Tax=Saccharomonospora iraqiensis TaxID=52698 RepID=UPI00022DED76|nr:DUF3515 domain-containing protein [Saccharomonospora iraqiensis]